jgi:hypothetical protein
MKVIFLDIDGVLNSGRSVIAFAYKAKEETNEPYGVRFAKATVDPVSVGLLNRVLRDFDAKIVLSSTHRSHFDEPNKLQKIQEYLTSLGVEGDRCIGFTPSLHTIRGIEIQAWINNNPRHQIKNMIILDDSSDFLPSQKEFHVHCEGGNGISEENYHQMTRLFGREDSGLILF